MHGTGPRRDARSRTADWKLLALTGALVGLGASCSAGSGSPHSRLAAVHNAFQAIGMGQLGRISEGSLAEGNLARFPMDLEAQCYTFAAFGGDGARNIDVAVLDPNGQRVAGDASSDTQATAQFCAPVRGRYTVTVRMTAGGGTYVLSSWGGGSRGSSGNQMAAVGGDGAGTCRQPIPIQIGATVTGDTSSRQGQHNGSCVEGEAPEIVYQLTVDRRLQVTLAAEQDYDGALYIRTNCDDQESEVPGACNDDDQNTSHSRVVTVLDPGTYFIFADGFSDNRGSFTLSVTGQDVPSPQDVCGQAAALTPGQAVSGQTTGDPNVFQATCAQGARGPDRVYRLDVQQESRLQLYQESDYDGVLYVRRACADQGSELACNDDAEDVQHSRINEVLPPGTYYVFTDGYTPQAAGNYTLQADLAPVAGVGGPGDSCADAQPLTPGQAVEGNTFPARDDVQAPCGTQQDGYDVVYRLDVRNRSRVRLWFEHADMGPNAVLYLTRGCAATTPNANVACRAGAINDDTALDAVVEPGQYFVVVDSATPRRFGRFRLQSRVEDLTELDRACRTAPMLRNRQTVRGTTQGDDRFQSSCAGGSRSAENLYRLRLTRRSFVRLALHTTSGHDPSVYIRATCTDPSTERACNDDHNDTQHSLIETTLEPGTYTVFVDGFSSRNNGTYEMEVTINPQ